MAEHLDATDWELFEAVRNLNDERAPSAREINEELREALTSDEHVHGLASALKGAQSRAVQLLARTPAPQPTPPVEPPPIRPAEFEQERGTRTIEEDARENLEIRAAKDLLTNLEGKLTAGRRIRINIGWRIEEGGEQR